eukprot:566902-Rhodomonas_salina.3
MAGMTQLSLRLPSDCRCLRGISNRGLSRKRACMCQEHTYCMSRRSQARIPLQIRTADTPAVLPSR